MCFQLAGGRVTRIASDAVLLQSLALHDGVVHVGSIEAGVFRVEGDALVSMKPQAKGGAMSSAGGFLWTCGLEQIARYDGTNWRARQMI